MPSTRLPTTAGCDLRDAGEDWDAIRMPVRLGVAAMAILGVRCGAVLEDPLSRTLYYFVPRGTAQQWNVQGTRAIGAGTSITVPPPRRITGPGPHWRVCPGDGSWVTDAPALQAALEDCLASEEALSA